MCEQQARIIQKQHDDHIEMITTEARTGHFRFDPNTHTSITMQDLVSNVQRSQAFARDSTHQAPVSPAQLRNNTKPVSPAQGDGVRHGAVSPFDDDDTQSLSDSIFGKMSWCD
jgi:hypothetical protein